VTAFALLLLAQKILIVLWDPVFTGDAGIRMDTAFRPIFLLGNRMWLPYLQLHIWIFYLLKMPYRFYNLIPCFYFFVAVLSLGLLSLRQLGRTWPGILFTLALILGFAQQQLASRMSTTLYQEILGAAFLYLLLDLGALQLRKSRILLALGILALLTRDTFQFYLLSLTLLNWKTIVRDGDYRRSFLLLWAVPAGWLLSIPFLHLWHDGRFPRSLVEWPLMINKDDPPVSLLSLSLSSLWTGLMFSRAAILALLVVLSGLAIRWGSKRAAPLPENGAGEFSRRFTPFSLLSLGMIYCAIILFNPTRATFGNSRMAFPLLEHLFVWALLALAASYSCRTAQRCTARILVIVGLVLSLNPTARAWIPRHNEVTTKVYPDLERLLHEVSPNATPVVCFGPDTIYDLYARFVAPTLYAQRRYLPEVPRIPGYCTVWISRPEAVPPDIGQFLKAREYKLGKVAYEVYRER